MACICGSTRPIFSVSGKTSDLCFVKYGEMEKEGYVPQGLGIGGGDYLEFEVCLDCGRLQGKFPISDETTKESLVGE